MRALSLTYHAHDPAGRFGAAQAGQRSAITRREHTSRCAVGIVKQFHEPGKLPGSQLQSAF
jgi:hypothetical protein